MMPSPAEIAAERFNKGFTCAQAVFGAYAEQVGVPTAMALKIATGFGAGIGRHQEVCGAVTGACMVISAKCGMTDATQTASKEQTYALEAEFIRRFRDQHGSMICLDLLGIDMGTEDGHKEMANRNLRETVCLPCVTNACRILDTLLFSEASPKE